MCHIGETHLKMTVRAPGAALPMQNSAAVSEFAAVAEIAAADFVKL